MVRLGIQAGLVAAEFAGATAGYGVHADFGFKIKDYGWIDFYPSVDFWLKNNDADPDDGFEINRIMELGLNLVELRYYPPIPEKIIVRPYIGVGATGVAGIEVRETWDGTDSTKSGIDFGADFIGGCDIVILSDVRAFVELRGKTAGYSTFKLYAGAAYIFGRNFRF
jgi:hypothetical protein